MILKIKEIDQVCTIHRGSNQVIREVKTRSEFDLLWLIVQQAGSRSLFHLHLHFPTIPVREKIVRSIIP